MKRSNINRQGSKANRGKVKSDSLVSKKQVLNMIHSNMDKVEMKYLNTTLYNVVVPAITGTLVIPGLPSQGVTNGEREGDSLSIDEIELRCVMINIADITTSSNASDAIRLVCVQSRSSLTPSISYSTTPATGIFDLGSSGAVDITSHINLYAKNHTFHVLYDKTHSVGFLSSSSLKLIDFRLKPKVHKVDFTPGTGNTLMGQIVWVAMSWQAGTTSLSLEQRLIYHDL
jgi:hypothetical protein